MLSGITGTSTTALKQSHQPLVALQNIGDPSSHNSPKSWIAGCLSSNIGTHGIYRQGGTWGGLSVGVGQSSLRRLVAVSMGAALSTELPCLAALQPGELRMSRRSWGRNRCRPPSCLSMPVRSCLCACCQEVDARRQNCLLLWHACRLEHGSMWSAEISGYFSCQGMFGRTHSF